MKKTFVKVLNIVVDVLVVCVLVISLLILTMVLTSKGGEDVPSVFGKAPISVLSDSMKGDAPDDFNKGDLILCDVVDHNIKNKYKVGDIVTFRQDINGDDIKEYVTHRIYKVNKNGSFKTKGDNNPTYDQDPKGNIVFSDISYGEILAKYTGSKISGLGDIIQYLQTPLGFFLVILLPMIIFFLYQAIRVVLNIIAYNKEKALTEAQEAIAGADLTEEQKQKAIAEYLAAQSADSGEAEKETPQEEQTDTVEETDEGE